MTNFTSFPIPTETVPSLPAATLPLDGNETYYAVQNGVDVKVTGAQIGLGWFNVKTYGATGNGSTDDTAAIQAAFNAMIAVAGPGGLGSVLYFPVGNYICAGTLNFYKIGVGTGSFTILGASNEAVFLNYQGSGTFINFSGFHCRMSDLTVITSNPGTGTGLNLGRPGGSGNNTQAALFENVTVQGFDTGIDSGASPNGTSSECSYINCNINACTTFGFRSHDFNSISHNFYNVSGGQCGSFFRITHGSQICVYGGSASGNNIDFDITASGEFIVSGFDSENVLTNFLNVVNAGGTTHTLVQNCNVNSGGGATALVNLNHSSRTTLVNNFIDGQVVMSASCILTMIGCGISDTSPFETTGAGGTMTYRVMGCFQTQIVTGNYVADFPDQSGYIKTGTGASQPNLQLTRNATSLAVCVVADLPAAASFQGYKAVVTDSTVAGSGNFGAIVAGASTNTVPVYSDGTNWRIG